MATTLVQAKVVEPTTHIDSPHNGERSAIVALEEVKGTPGLSFPPVGKRSLLHESTLLDQVPTQTLRRHSLELGAPQKESKEKTPSKNSLISDVGSTAERRRTYSGPVYTHSLSPEAKDQSCFPAGSVASLQTVDTYCTATSYVGSWHTAPSILEHNAKSSQRSLLRRTFRRLLQLNDLPSLVEDEDEAYDDIEYDWCGRGMHVDFVSGEKLPLEICDSAGHGSTSTIDIVKCRRIKLARKLTYMTHRTDKKLLLKEVQALQKLRHGHVVQLIGTYLQGRKFAALIYPVADMDLAVYLEEARYMPDAEWDWTDTTNYERAHRDVLSKGSLCLISALRYVHESGIKHMDIKPANILLKRYKPGEAYSYGISYKLYLCDFGLAQANFAEKSQTETYPGKTPMYASPEVAAYNLHGRASDLFSLGCVLLEMATVYSGLSVESLKVHIQTATTKSYHENLDSVRSWIGTLEDMKVSRTVLLGMLQERPQDRLNLVKSDGLICDLRCPHQDDPPEPFEADSEESEEDDSEPETAPPEMKETADIPTADIFLGDLKTATAMVKSSPRSPSFGRNKSIRQEISAPVKLISSTNVLIQDVPDI